MGEVNSYTSTASALLIGYGFIISVGVTFPGLNTLWQYFRGERLMIATFIRRLHARILTSGFTTLASILLSAFIIYPLFFGWSLDIFTSKMFGATMSPMVMIIQRWLLDFLRKQSEYFFYHVLATCRYSLLDLLALVVGIGIILTIIDATRD